MNSRGRRAASLEELQIELCRPGRLLVFIDDSGTSGQRLGKYLVRDYKLHAAVVVRSEDYRPFLNDHRALLQRYPWAGEFHAADVVGRTGSWKGRQLANRLNFFEAFRGHLRQLAKLILHVGIGIDQYNELMEKARRAGDEPTPYNWRWSSHSEGARAVLLKCVVGMTREALGNLPLVIVEDADERRENCNECMFHPDEDVFDNGVFRVDSKAIPGLQLADLAAYPLNRRFHIHARREQGGEIGPFDRAVEGILLENADKYRCVVGEAVPEVAA